jgi:hypothetical protein
MMSFEWELSDSGLIISLALEEKSFLKTKKRVLRIDEWRADKDARTLTGLVALHLYVENNEDSTATSVLVPHDAVAVMTDQEARALNLPVSVPYQLRIWSEGRQIDNSIQLQSEFLDMGKHVLVDGRIGSILIMGRKHYRIPSPLYELCEIVKKFPESADGKLESISQASALLGIETADIAADHLLKNIKLRHVAAFSASIDGKLDDPTINPVLFGKHIMDGLADSDEIVDESQQLLSLDQCAYFSEQFKKGTLAKRTYLLKNGEYIYIDPSIREAMEGFRKVCNADKDVRRAFIKSPTAVLSQYIVGDDNIDDILESAFIETSQFSDRVTEINKWVEPDLPFLVRIANHWGTEVLIFEQIGSAHTVVIPKDSLPHVAECLSGALQTGQKQLVVDGIDIPVTRELLGEMEELLPESKELPDTEGPGEGTEPENGPYVVQTIENFKAINYTKTQSPPKNPLRYDTPSVLAPKTNLLDHQKVGVNWIISAFNAGIPGVLIADDMGLGKTLQALVLLALYREQIPQAARKPALIVAPTGLLKNWLKEVGIHLGHDGLGVILEAYGTTLKTLKSQGARGKEIDRGVPLLDTARLSQADVVLTTYESLRDNHISFSQIGFGCIVFDEIQKVKNPKSLLTQTAKAMNGMFKVGLSGTPVENSLADLWSIFDVIAPGLLNFSLREFVKLFSGDPEENITKHALEELQSQLLESVDGSIPIILRRMKDVVFKDAGPNGKPMPKKIITPAESTCQTMPNEQSSAYSYASNQVLSKKISMIEGIQAWKKISLSPVKPANWVMDVEGSILGSARLSEAFKILDRVNAINEKVLIFVESRAVQPQLAVIMKERYGMRKSPLIVNGAISGEARQKCVDQFQASDAGFNAMIISPKAGGVGLTLTEANHVLHLERWWNPAVEDQCNDRAYRIGQEKDVTIYTPVARHPEIGDKSFDLVLDRILARKRLLARSIFVPTELKPSDFEAIFNPIDEIRSSRPITIDESYQIDDTEHFEDYVALSLANSGFKVHRAPRSQEEGNDLIVSIEGEKLLCQVKQVRLDKILTNGIQEILEAKSRFDNTTRLVLFTNSRSVANDQQQLAIKSNVIVICGDAIEDYGSALLVFLAINSR